ncbi:hypothetical protein BL243_24545 [Ralstonia solanacearum]|nr:hypothetical protein BL243_24545 [Ralstonia solanacearum]
MSTTGRGQVGFDRADQLVRAIYDGGELGRDLLFQLENEGLLAVEQDRFSSVGAEQVVRFTFERMGDHVIVADLLNRSASTSAVESICAPGSPLHQALEDRKSFIVPGLLEALAIQLPERFGLELPELTGVPDSLWLTPAFENSLLSRRPTAFTARTWELVDELGDPRLRFDTLIALSTEPDHPFNVRVLDAELRDLPMPERDAQWSAHIAKSERAQHLVDWAWNADQLRVTAKRAELTAIQLAWFFTTTLRPLRDQATKALVTLLAGRPLLAIKLWSQFKDVDDGYLTERVMGALYGAAMQGGWGSTELSAIAKTVYDDLFANRTPPANVLLRDHALGLVGYARYRGATSEGINADNLQGPFISSWPIEHVPDETIDTYTRQYDENGKWKDEIVQSCQDGDFARYILDSAVQDWSPAPLGTLPLPTALDLRDIWYSEFKASATPEMIVAHDLLVETIKKENPRETVMFGEALDKVRDAKAAFRAIVGSEVFEEWREKAEHWRAEGMYQSFAKQGPAEFNLAWARRWVAKRAHDLGWTEQLHGEFDRNVRGDRTEHSLERIGKKYQWLALYELVARMSDNLEPLPDREVDSLRLRNIDPSLLVQKTADNGWRTFEDSAFWIGASPDLLAETPTEAIAWLHSTDDILDGVENIEVRSPGDERDWLVLRGFETWRSPSHGTHCEAWRRVACFVVQAADRDAALKMLASEQMVDPHAVPSAEGAGYHVHLGEFPWRSITEDHDDWIPDWHHFGSLAKPKPKVAVRPTTAEYSAEASGYDGSVSENISLHMPAQWLMKGLALRLTDGHSIQYKDSEGVIRFMDPSVRKVGRSAALVDRGAFLELLKRDGLVAIWTVAGEKNAYGDTENRGFGGRFTYTRLFYSDSGDIRTLDRLERFDQPSPRQRALFLGEPVPNEEADLGPESDSWDEAFDTEIDVHELDLEALNPNANSNQRDEGPA